MSNNAPNYPNPVEVGPHRLLGFLAVPVRSKGLVIFAHGSGSGRLSPRNNHVASELQKAGYATLLLDLLTSAEEQNRANVFDMGLLASRLIEATDWAAEVAKISHLPTAYFGASTGAGAALLAAALRDGRIGAVVSRGGRPDLAGHALSQVGAPTLLLVGSLDTDVLELNRSAFAQLRCEKDLQVIPGATHLFEEPGTLDLVVDEAIRWFDRHLAGPDLEVRLPFADRATAGRSLAQALHRFKVAKPLILALPRGGVPVAFEVARELETDLDLLLVRKLGAPGQPELGIGAVIDGEQPEVVLNDDIVRHLALPAAYVHNETHRQIREIERRREEYLGGAAQIPIEGRTVIVVDDGVATGGTVRAALKALRKKQPAKLILAIPVAPPEVLASLAEECDEIVSLATPEPFYAVGAHYLDFTQTSDEEVKKLLIANANRQPELSY
jgi:predicted phosphoribosyltransferase/pimeloyl-ACP methyl ester carboxylesterase